MTAATLVTAFTAARTDPWLRPHLLAAAMSLAREIAKADPRLARALYDATKEPFAVEAQRELRLATAAEIAAVLPDPAVCVEALEKLEPPPADREVLVLRAHCYRREAHPRAAAAEDDLVQLIDREAPLGASIPTPPAAGDTDPGGRAR